MMSLLHPFLEAFVSVAQSESITAGAKLMGLTQAAMTQKIQSLESSLGFSVFTRKRTGVSLTAEGERLYAHVLKIKEWQGEWDSLTDHKSVTVSGPSSIMRSRIIPCLVPLLTKSPSLKIQFDLIDTESAMFKLKKGDAHIVIVNPEEVMLELDSKLIRPERYILVGPKQWKKRKLVEILENETIVDFDPQDKMTYNFLSKYNLKSNKERCFANNTDALLSLVQNGVGYSVLSEDFVSNELRSGSLIDLAPGKFIETKVAVCFYPRKFMPEYMKEIIRLMR